MKTLVLNKIKEEKFSKVVWQVKEITSQYIKVIIDDTEENAELLNELKEWFASKSASVNENEDDTCYLFTDLVVRFYYLSSEEN